MANKTFKDSGFKIDNASGTLTDISAYINQATINGTQDLLEDTGLGVDERTYLPGLAGATIAMNGWINTTTDGIFGPLIGNRTSSTKTVQYQAYSGRYYNGEVRPSDVTIVGQAGQLQTLSANLTFTGAVSRTTKALS